MRLNRSGKLCLRRRQASNPPGSTSVDKYDSATVGTAVRGLMVADQLVRNATRHAKRLELEASCRVIAEALQHLVVARRSIMEVLTKEQEQNLGD